MLPEDFTGPITHSHLKGHFPGHVLVVLVFEHYLQGQAVPSTPNHCKRVRVLEYKLQRTSKLGVCTCCPEGVFNNLQHLTPLDRVFVRRHKGTITGVVIPDNFGHSNLIVLDKVVKHIFLMSEPFHVAQTILFGKRSLNT